MNFPRTHSFRTRQWVTVGFGAVLIALLGTALLARQAIINRVEPLEWTEDESNGYNLLNRILVAIATADAHQHAYFETGQDESIDAFYEQLEIVDTYRSELFDDEEEDLEDNLDDLELDDLEDDEDLEDDSTYSILLEELNRAVENRLEILTVGIEKYKAGELDTQTQLALIQQNRDAQLDIQYAIQALIEEGNVERQWDIADTSLQANNELWLMGLTVGIGSVVLGLLYGYLTQILRRNDLIAAELHRKNQTLSETLQRQNADLQSAKAALKVELGHRQEIEATYKEIEQAKELTDLKLNFFSLASHELRTPLSAILVSAQLLDNPNAKWTEEKRSRNLKRIQSAAKTMTQLLADILLLTRAEAGKLEFNPQMIELQEFCTRLVEEVTFNTQAQHRISVFQQGTCDTAYLDEKLIRAMLMSLLTNAIKYSPQESEIEFTVWGENARTRFQICDQGIGIPPADQNYLFESFHRGQNVQSISGTGLGLAVVKKCLDLHGGTIDVESQVGVGTRFTIDVPWANQPIEQNRVGRVRVSGELTDSSKKKT